MNRLLACRVCLAYNTRLCSIMDGQFCDIYEKLVEASLDTEDKSPTSVCYICFASMKKILQFRDRSQKANQILQQMMSSGLEPSVSSMDMLLKEQAGISWTLGISDIERTTTTSGEVEVQVKIESVKLEMDIDGPSDRNEAEPESDQEPGITVENSAAIVWNGCINMVDVARCYVAAREASGSASDLEEDLSAEFEIVGNPDLVWGYIKTERASNKDIDVLKLQAANDEQKMQFNALYSYLSSRNRSGVVKVSNSSAVKNIYIVPLPANTPVPSVLSPLDGPGLGEVETHLLICIVIRQREKRIAPHIPKEIVPEKPSISSLDMLVKDQAGISWTLGMSDIERTITTQVEIESVKLEMDIDDGMSDRNEAEPESDQEPGITFKNSAAIVWNGCINMVDVARCYVAAHEASGSASDLEEDLGAELEIVGRINPDTAWDYINKMKRATNKDIVVLKLQAANDEDKMQYIALYSYLSSRNRLGVVKVSNTSAVKDIYIVPLPANTPVPSVLSPLDGPGLGEIETHLLICIVIRQRKKRIAPHIPKEIVPEKVTYTPPPAASPRHRALPLPQPTYTSPALSSVKDKNAASLGAAPPENRKLDNAENELVNIQEPLRKTKNNEEPIEKKEDQRKIPAFEKGREIFTSTILKETEMTTSHIISEQQKDSAFNKNYTVTPPKDNFTCDFCKNVYQCKNVLECHMKKSHIMEFTRKDSITSDLNVANECKSTNLLKVQEIQYNDNREEKDRREKKFRLKTCQYECPYCMKIFTKNNDLTRHVRYHTKEKPFKCDICEKFFSQGSNLIAHLRVHKKPFKCYICEKCFADSSSLNEHLIVHTKEKHFKCDICEKFFSQRSNLIAHLRVHKKPFKCNICEKYFSQNGNLTQHLRVHKKPFKCNICEKYFSQNGNLTQHLRVHTKEKHFKCDICEKYFSQKGNLTKHLRVHTKEKPFKCDLCEKCFAGSSCLARHLRVHTKEKPFKCDICDRFFSQRSALVGHFRVHTKEKPFKCNTCEKCFSRSSNLIAHLRVHIKKTF